MYALEMFDLMSKTQISKLFTQFNEISLRKSLDWSEDPMQKIPEI